MSIGYKNGIKGSPVEVTQGDSEASGSNVTGISSSFFAQEQR